MEKEGNDIERKFFFSMSEASLYDATIRLTVPYYDIILEALVNILNYHFGVAYGEDPQSIRGVFLDVGAGTGNDSLPVLKTFPNSKLLAVDIAPPMKKEFSDNYSKFLDNEMKRAEFIVSDILDLKFNSDTKYNLTKFKDEKRIGAFSAYCLHHFDLETKKEVYQKMYDFLDENGILINIDLFNYESKTFSEHFDHADIEYIKQQFDNPNPEFKGSHQIPIEIRLDLKEKWVQHMKHDNKLDSVEAQIKILRSIGFKNVECPFRYLQQGIIIGTK